MDRSPIKGWVNRWRETGKALNALRIEEFRRSDPSSVFLSLTDASEAALIAYPPKPTSGLVEMQKFFRKLAEK